MNSKRASFVIACVASASLTSFSAFADGADDQKATAQVLFEEARAAVTLGHFAEACPKLAESQRIDPGLGTQLWLADCYDNNGQTATAWGAFKEAVATARLRGDPREQVALDRVAALEARLSRLTIIVPPVSAVPGVDVRRDGIAITPLLWGAALPLDPGIHAIAVRAPGKKEWSTTVTIPADAKVVQVIVPVLDADETAPTARAHPLAMAPVKPVSTTQRWIGIGTTALGSVAIGLGAYFAFNAKSIYDTANREGHCASNNVCDKEGAQDRQNAFDQASVATAAFVAGAVAIVGGIVIIATAPRAVSLTISPSLRGASFSASLHF